ncbi:MAG: RsbRD N-terminal domain-containing protein [Gemmatimonadota bacterium]|nr:RsbRD N-terminal domain-containing protein [Gemmatimonadota bacterium]
MDIAQWLEARKDQIASRWMAALANARPGDKALVDLGPALCEALASLLPGVLTAYRHQIEPLWRDASALYGSVAARRGLSAGEVIEEFHELRDVLLRLLFEDPPMASGARLSLREVLHLNRIIDVGVTQASVGHTDLLFFSLIHGSGVPTPLEDEDRREVKDQLEAIAADGVRIMRILRVDRA